jgi:lincosamide nucleotidyltransferase A/C/D/E
MLAADVRLVLDALEGAAVGCWVDGGWGVDALLGRQTRPHSDLDLVVARAQLDHVRSWLAGRGYAVTRDWLPTAVAFEDGAGREVDLHPVDPTPDGGGDQFLLDGGVWHYSAPVQGMIDGRPVRCCPPSDQLLMHLGYEPRDTDVHDVRLLSQRYAIPLPEPYEALTGPRPYLAGDDRPSEQPPPVR